MVVPIYPDRELKHGVVAWPAVVIPGHEKLVIDGRQGLQRVLPLCDHALHLAPEGSVERCALERHIRQPDKWIQATGHPGEVDVECLTLFQTGNHIKRGFPQVDEAGQLLDPAFRDLVGGRGTGLGMGQGRRHEQRQSKS